MRVMGISALSHDASITVVEDDKILFAAHSERYSRVKNDELLNNAIINEALSYGIPDKIVWYEKPILKKWRQLYAGQYKEVFSLDNIPKVYLKQFTQLDDIPISYQDHHMSHVAASLYTSGWPRDEKSAVVVLDGIGEWATASIYVDSAENGLKKLHQSNYPHSLGLLYTAFTQLVGLKPNEDEYILMGMAGYGKPNYKTQIQNDFIANSATVQLKANTHVGLQTDYLKDADDFDIAASIQAVLEDALDEIFYRAKVLTGAKRVAYSGGIALNCVANGIIHKHFDEVWIMPNPGDAGSSLGAAASEFGYVDWKDPYLGTNIEGDYPVNKALQALKNGEIFGIANGRAEFGPRALGNRSLMADPRGQEIKDRMNVYKRRQKFRPFAPIILEEYLHDFFEMPEGVDSSPYMQYVGVCKYPELYPAICHVDNTSRVQTVNKNQHPGLYDLLERFFKETGCPMLVNTSLNIKGEPLVNDEEDAQRFSDRYAEIEVFLRD